VTDCDLLSHFTGLIPHHRATDIKRHTPRDARAPKCHCDSCSRHTRSTRLIESRRCAFAVYSSPEWMATFSSLRAFVVISMLSVVSVN